MSEFLGNCFPARRCGLLGAIAVFAAGAVFAAAAATVLHAEAGPRMTQPVASQPTAGPIHLLVDVTRAPQRILHSHMQIPVHAGPLTLQYPKWIPGEHMPDGPIIEVAGLKFRAGGKAIPWRRDLVEMFSFHLTVPEGVTSIEADLDFLLGGAGSSFSGGGSATAALDVVSWNQLLLYPQGFASNDVTFLPSLRLPAGWKFGTALPGAKVNGDTVEFAATPLTTLVDSPVIAGRYFRAIQLTPGQSPPHEVDIVADSAAALAMSPETQKELRQLVDETGALFGSRHYRDYHFLVTLSDDVAHFGLEHHESSDDRTYERSLIDEAYRIQFAGLLPHEFTHSWNGKYRRPVGLATPDYQQPMKDDLLWVYEGLTEYLGEVLTARSGLLTEEQSHEELAHLIAQYQHRPGRDWRPLQDTADAAPFLYDATPDWENLRRSVDFYQEGEMLWLDVDSTLRAITKDQKSMNDFCKIFHGGPGGEPALKTYNFEDVVSTLNGLAPHDWAGFLRARLDGVATNTPTEALENSGWKLVYTEQPNEMESTADGISMHVGLMNSIGLSLANDGTVVDVLYDGPAYKAGIGPGMKLQAVEGRQYSADDLKDAIDAAKSTSTPMQLMLTNGAEFKSYSVDYHGGLRYPHIERDSSRPDYLSEILHPMARER
jgi:predicted metalloprotease with PDZ domain